MRISYLCQSPRDYIPGQRGDCFRRYFWLGPESHARALLLIALPQGYLLPRDAFHANALYVLVQVKRREFSVTYLFSY